MPLQENNEFITFETNKCNKNQKLQFFDTGQKFNFFRKNNFEDIN